MAIPAECANPSRQNLLTIVWVGGVWWLIVLKVLQLSEQTPRPHRAPSKEYAVKIAPG